jgi:hypothetical protein
VASKLAGGWAGDQCAGRWVVAPCVGSGLEGCFSLKFLKISVRSHQTYGVRSLRINEQLLYMLAGNSKTYFMQLL